MKVTIGISNRHVHLTKDTYDYLFDGKEMEKRNDLNQVGEFASTDTVDIIYDDKVIEHVRVLGPSRSYNQIELLGSDLAKLGLSAPTRRSGDLDGTPSVIIRNGSKEVESDGVIRALRHVHVPAKDKIALGLEDNEIVKIKGKSCEFEATVKVTENAFFEVHIDKDEALEYGLVSNEEVELVKCGK